MSRAPWGPMLIAFVLGGVIGQRFNHVHPLVTTNAGRPPTP